MECHGDSTTIEQIVRLLDLEKPDLVVFSGDNINGEGKLTLLFHVLYDICISFSFCFRTDTHTHTYRKKERERDTKKGITFSYDSSFSIPPLLLIWIYFEI